MSQPEGGDAASIDAATKRLSAALDALEHAVERRLESDREGALLASRIQLLSTDRSRLASELDNAASRAQVLETTNREIAQRLDVAIGTIRDVLETERS